MQDVKHLYEYAVIRYVPRIEREEFINVGIAMLCKRCKWLKVRLNVDQDRLEALKCGENRAMLDTQLGLFTAVGNGEASSGHISGMEPEERFRWLTAVKSSCLQTSRPHPGLSTDLDATFERLFAESALL